MELRMCIQKLSRSSRILTNILTRNINHYTSSRPWIHPAEQKPSTNTPPGFEVTSDPEDFKFVDRLKPLEVVPAPPEHKTYPTPSGWVPPKGDNTLPYYVNRSSQHQLPVYYKRVMRGGRRQVTHIHNVDGDIWALEAELRNHLEAVKNKKIYTQVHELGRFIRVKGIHLEAVADFLLQKGF